MLCGAAGRPRSRPPCDGAHAGAGRYPVYSLFATPHAVQRPTLHRVTDRLFSASLSLGTPLAAPLAAGPLQFELRDTYEQRLLLHHDKDHSKMDESKVGKQCITETVGCCPGTGERQLLEGVAGVMQPLAIKTENATRRNCNTCITASPKKVMQGTEGGGCSRTNPVTWLGVAGQNVHVQVKREPQHLHVSELVAVKLEQASPGNKPDQAHAIPASLNNGSIPVGIAVARQRVGEAGLLAALSKDTQQRLHDIDPAGVGGAQAAMTVGVAGVGGALLHCDERGAPLGWPAPAAPPAAPPPLWQYPSAQVSMESMMVGGVGGVGSVGSVGGFQLVREPTSGALLLLPAAPELPHTLVWGGVGYPSAPLLLPPAPHAHAAHPLLLPGDLLTSATLQHTHTHSTRLVALAPAPAPTAPSQPIHPPPAHLGEKRKTLLQPLLPQHALIKIEPEPTHDKPEPVTMPLTTHLYYQSQSDTAGSVGAVTATIAVEGQGQGQGCRSQGTSPVAPATPPDGGEEAPATPAHRDASNQTDQIDDDEDIVPQDENERDLACIGVAHQPNIHRDSPHLDPAEESLLESLAPSNVVGAVEKAIDAIGREEVLADISSNNTTDHELVIDSGCTTSVPVLLAPTRPLVDVSGLELLSNSIEQFERTTPAAPPPTGTGHLPIPPPLTVDTRGPLPGVIIKCSPKSPPSTGTDSHRRFEFPSNTDDRTKPSLDGLGLLCALAEQRFMEEVERPAATSAAGPLLRPYIKSEPLLSPTEMSQKVIESSSKDKKERHRHRDGESSGERRHKRSREREDRLRHKLEKVRRHKRERDHDSDRSEIEASLRRVTSCSCGTPTCAHSTGVHSALFDAMEKDMRERLRDLQRQCDEKLAQLDALAPTASPATPSAPSPDSDRSSSKKRKVGRPRKVSSPDSTETIVAKKPKSKSSLVGYLLAKGRLKGGIVCSRTDPPREHAYRTSKVRPKLKAEPIVKAYSEEDESEWPLDRSASSSMESLNEVRLKNRQNTDRLARKHSRDELPLAVSNRLSVDADTDFDKERRRAKKRRKSIKLRELASNEESKTEKEEGNIGEVTMAVEQRPRCTLTETLLDTGPRVLTAMGGLFYAGRLSAVRAPDVYAITLDGERGNKPHILSREETLRDAILEVNPSSAAELRAGTRVCAYWSQQYRCLYPGTVAEDPPTDPGDKFVAVEFDDGDSGRIALEDIRLLEPNYPVVEYDVNPLLTLGKRRRNTSVNSTDDKRSAVSTTTVPALEQLKPTSNSVCENASQKTNSDDERHKKKVKKHRKEKLKRSHSDEKESVPEDYVKKRKKKHKCCGDRCKRRHHKKHHRKHRKRHHSGCREHSSSSGDDQQRHRSSSEYQDSSKNEDSGDSNDRLSTLIAIEKSPDDKMKTVIKKAVLSKKALVKNAVLDFSNLGQLVDKKEDSAKIEVKDNMKDSGIGMDEDAPVAADGNKKKKKHRSVSSTSSDGGANANGGTSGAGTSGGVSKMAAFLPGGALWRWNGAAYRRMARPRHRKLFYRAIQRGDETLAVGEAAVFLSTGRPDRPYIGRIVALWQARGAMAVRVNWFYHPEETTGAPGQLLYPGGLFESPHTDENDVQTISHKCEVLPLEQYRERMGDDPARYGAVYDNNDLYYLAGRYDPTQRTLRLEADIPLAASS